MKNHCKKNTLAAMAVLPFIAAGSQAHAALPSGQGSVLVDKAFASLTVVDSIAGFPALFESAVVAQAKTRKKTKKNVSPTRPTVKKPKNG